MNHTVIGIDIVNREFQLHFIARDNILGGHFERGGAKVHSHYFLDQRNLVTNPGPFTFQKRPSVNTAPRSYSRKIQIVQNKIAIRNIAAMAKQQRLPNLFAATWEFSFRLKARD